MSPFIIAIFGLLAISSSVAAQAAPHVDWQAEFNRLRPEYEDFTYPFDTPGQLFPGITVQGVIQTAGEAWNAPTILESLGIACRDVAPSMTLLLGPDTVGQICDPIFQALTPGNRVDGIGLCNNVYSLVNGVNRRKKRYSDYYYPYGIAALRPFDPLEILERASQDVLGLQSYDQNSVCSTFDRIVNDAAISLPSLVEEFASELLVLAIPRGAEVCESWDEITAAFRPGGMDYDYISPEYGVLLDELPDLIGEVTGFHYRESLCSRLTYFVDYDVDILLRGLASRMLGSVYHKVSATDQCSTFAGRIAALIMGVDADSVDDYISPSIQMIFDLQSLDEVCDVVEIALARTDVDECASNPCMNGGFCEDGTDGFTCQCYAGFVGVLCEINVDECASNPCMNGGICEDGTNGFTCQCHAGFIGALCETSSGRKRRSPARLDNAREKRAKGRPSRSDNRRHRGDDGTRERRARHVH